MQIKEFLNSVCEQIKYKPIREDISAELKNHIEETKEAYIENGMSSEEAEEKAVFQMGDAIEIGKNLNRIHKPKLDKTLLILTIIPLIFGLLVAYIRNDSTAINLTENSFLKFIVILIIGLGLGIGIYFINYKKILKYSNLFFCFATVLMLICFWTGNTINGKAYYLNLGILNFSVPTVVMPIYVISFIGFLEKMYEENKFSLEVNGLKINLNLIKIYVATGISLAVMMEASLVNFTILTITYLILFSVKLLQKKKFIMLIVTWIILLIILFSCILLYFYAGGFISNRVIGSFLPETDPQGSGWLGINQNKIINTAKPFGKAENMSDALKLFEEGTNYAFISILANYGWVVALFMVTAVILLNIKLIINSLKIKDFYGKMLIIGFSSMFIIQSLFNILMNLNIGLKVNINLPLVSYGGTELIVNIAIISLILAIYRRKDILVKE